MNVNENRNWNESRFISTFNSRFNGTAEEAKAGNNHPSAESFNNSLSIQVTVMVIMVAVLVLETIMTVILGVTKDWLYETRDEFHKEFKNNC